MFVLREKLKCLDIPAQRVLRLQRSIADLQVALPGHVSQLATAYVCAFSADKGARVAVAFHLHDQHTVVYYLNDDGEVSRKDAGRVLNEGLFFAESMGFMLSDLDIHQADPEARKALWESLPLKTVPEKPKPEATDDNNDGELAAGAEDPLELDLGLPRRQPLAEQKMKKKPPTPEELEQKRVRLRENLGRFLSSM